MGECSGREGEGTGGSGGAEGGLVAGISGEGYESGDICPGSSDKKTRITRVLRRVSGIGGVYMGVLGLCSLTL